jgi:hypothetical protein
LSWYLYELSQKIKNSTRKKEENSKNEYKVDKIKASNTEGKYLVSWNGYDSSDDTWERFDNICHTEVFEKFQVTLFSNF